MISFKILLFLFEISVALTLLLICVKGDGRIEVKLKVLRSQKIGFLNPAELPSSQPLVRYKLNLFFEHGAKFETTRMKLEPGVPEVFNESPIRVNGTFEGKLQPIFVAKCEKLNGSSDHSGTQMQVSSNVTIRNWTENGQIFNLTFPDANLCNWEFQLNVVCAEHFYDPIDCGFYKFCDTNLLHVNSCAERGKAICHSGWEGPNCTADVNECTERKSLCQNDGECVNAVGSFKCNCRPGYRGRTCEEKIDECVGLIDMCNNGGVCISTKQGQVCDCPVGYRGAACDKKVSTCDSNHPCLHGGTCNVSFNAYHCKCPPMFFGDHCENQIPSKVQRSDFSDVIIFASTIGFILVVVLLLILFLLGKKFSKSSNDASPS